MFNKSDYNPNAVYSLRQVKIFYFVKYMQKQEII
jgi:hypothetical protein